jgi:hypothetical protein
VAPAAAPSPGAPTVVALRTLPPLASLPSGVGFVLTRMAPWAGIAASTARSRTRLLRCDVTGLPLYAFGGTQGRVCFFLWPGGGSCGPVTSTHRVLWKVNGGSRKRGQAVVGVVSDGVRAVDVSLRGRVVRVRVVHNAFVFPFRLGRYEVLPQPRVRPVAR